MKSGKEPKRESDAATLGERTGARDVAISEISMIDVQILPCPFCGDTDPAIDEIDSDVWAVCCNECLAIGPHQDGAQTTEQAIEKWNRRN